MAIEKCWSGMSNSKSFLVVGLLCFICVIQSTAVKVNVTPFCENATVSSAEKGQKELLSAVKSNRPQMVMVLTSKGINIDMKTDSGDSLLHVAVMCASNDVARTLLKLGMDPDPKGYKGVTPLYRATEINDVPMMKDLYEKGADIHFRNGKLNDSLLHLACQKGNEEAGAWLVDAGLDVDLRNNRSTAPLHLCVQNGHQKLAKVLIERGASINSRDRDGFTPMHFAAKSGELNIARYLVDLGANIKATSNVGITPLHRAVEGGNAAVVDLLLDKGASVNAMMTVVGVSPLHLAIFDLTIVKLLIKRGADVNLKTHHGDIPLHWAASGTAVVQPNIVRELISRGSDVNSQSRYGWTPLHISALHGLHSIVKILLDNGANLNATDVSGRTPLHYAAARGDVDIVKMIIRRGAATNIHDVEGDTPLSWAINTGNLEVVEVLKRLQH